MTRAATATQTETILSASRDAVTELVPDAQLASYRRRQHAAGRFITKSVMAGGGGYYVTTVEDRRRAPSAGPVAP